MPDAVVISAARAVAPNLEDVARRVVPALSTSSLERQAIVSEFSSQLDDLRAALDRGDRLQVTGRLASAKQTLTRLGDVHLDPELAVAALALERVVRHLDAPENAP